MADGKNNKRAGKKIRLGKLDMKERFADRDEYVAALSDMQLAMLRVQQAYFHEGRRAIVLFEGWDAAGKGGAIRRLTEHLDPRGCKVWPIGAPKTEEQGRHYLYRFWQRLPERGTIAVFDRSWYGRVLVERVEGFAARPDWERAYREINEFERMLTDDGVRIVKLFLHITQEEQLRRFTERLRNPYKHWKITGEDLRNRAHWPIYVDAIHDMFDRTSTDYAPWHALAANYKWHARVRALKTVVKALSEGVSLMPPPIDPHVQEEAAAALGVSITLLVDGQTGKKQKGGKKGKKKAKKGKDGKRAARNALGEAIDA
jgi:polyphosphate kinase 2 (PPK2 family)